MLTIYTHSHLCVHLQRDNSSDNGGQLSSFPLEHYREYFCLHMTCIHFTQSYVFTNIDTPCYSYTCASFQLSCMHSFGFVDEHACMHISFLALPLRSWRDLMFEAVFDTFTNTQAPQFSKFVICTCKPEHYISFTFACFFSYDKGLHWRFPMSALVYLLASLSIFKYSECVLVTLNFTFLSYTFEHVTVSV
jgi:hypothetical protein